MVWKQLEPTEAHLTYLILSAFLIIYALFSTFIRNRLHLSEPPLALLTGVAVGPKGFNALDPRGWGFEDDVTLEFARVITSLQVFAVGLELPKGYFSKHWRSVAIFLGPVMTFGWLISALFIHLLFNTGATSALIISACLTPTDPVLAASILGNSRFSGRVPARIRHLLAAESGCNDGVSFPFIYAGIWALLKLTAGSTIRDWFLITVLYQCVLGSIVGVVLGLASNRILRFSYGRDLVGSSSFIVFYLLLAILATGIASTLGLDDFLVAFFAGAAFSHDGWFAALTRESKLNNVLDLLLNSTFFVYLGTIIPWDRYSSGFPTIEVTPGKLVGLLLLVLALRRIPIVLACKRFIPDLRTWTEALFCGHFGPMGVGAIFLAIEARAQLETESSIPLPRPSPNLKYYREIEFVWIIVTFIVMGSTLVHGFSVAVISLYVHYTRKPHQRALDIAGESDPLTGMDHEEENEITQSESSDVDDDGDNIRRIGPIRLPT